jgi:hypothetical protein
MSSTTCDLGLDDAQVGGRAGPPITKELIVVITREPLGSGGEDTVRHHSPVAAAKPSMIGSCQN